MTHSLVAEGVFRARYAWHDGGLARGTVAVVVAVVLGSGLVVLGALTSWYGWLTVGLGFGLVLAAATTVEQTAVPVVIMPALLLVERALGDLLTVSDLALFVAFWFALVFVPRPFTREFRTALWLTVVYQAASLFTVVAHPYEQNAVEWFHAWLSVGGALLVGYAAGRGGYHRLALGLLVGACVLIALQTCVTAAVQLAQGNTGPVYLDWPLAMHKNLIGCVLGFAAVIAYARPHWTGWPRRFALPIFWLCTLGVVAAQARQALVGLVVGVLVVALRPDQDRKRSRTILLAIIPAVAFVVQLVSEQLASGNQFNSAYQRLSWYEQAVEVWLMDPWFGMGLRWWVAGRTEYVFQPPNVELEVLSSTGVVGLTGFLILFGGMFVLCLRLEPRFGTTALAILVTRFVQGQFDLFWTSVVVTVPFVVAGVAFGAQAYAESVRGPAPPPVRAG